MSHVFNSRALTGEKPCINKTIHALLMHGYATAVTRCVLLGPRTSIVRGNCVRETSVKKRNKIVQEITRNAANVFRFYAIIAVEHGFSMHKHSPGSVGGVENCGLASGFGFQHLPRELVNVNEKNMFGPCTHRALDKACLPILFSTKIIRCGYSVKAPQQGNIFFPGEIGKILSGYPLLS